MTRANPNSPGTAGARPSSGSSVAMYKMGGRLYPMTAQSHCHVCNSRYRREIEVGIANGHAYAAIQTSIKAGDDTFEVSVASMRRHYERGHMPLDTEAVRRKLERRALQRGADLDAGVESLVDGMGLAEAVVQKTFEAIQSGELNPDVKDGLAAATLMERFAPIEASVSTEAYGQAFVVYFDTAQKVMTPGQFEEFGRRLQSDPTLKALIERYASDDPYADTSASGPQANRPAVVAVASEEVLTEVDVESATTL